MHESYALMTASRFCRCSGPQLHKLQQVYLEQRPGEAVNQPPRLHVSNFLKKRADICWKIRKLFFRTPDIYHRAAKLKLGKADTKQFLLQCHLLINSWTYMELYRRWNPTKRVQLLTPSVASCRWIIIIIIINKYVTNFLLLLAQKIKV